MSAHHLKIYLDKYELLFLPGKGSPTQDLTITFDNSVLAPTQTTRNLGVTLDSQLSLTANITATTHSCRCMLHDIRRIRPILTQKAAQVCVQALVISRLDYCNSLLAGLPVSAIRPLQLIQTVVARLVFNLPKFTNTTPLPSLVTSGCLQDMVKPYTPACSLCICQSATCSLTASYPLNKITTVCRKSIYLPPQTKNTSLPTIPWIKKK